MNLITSKISRMLSITTRDMPVYVVENIKLSEDIRRGWSPREVRTISEKDIDVNARGLTIINDNSFIVNYG